MFDIFYENVRETGILKFFGDFWLLVGKNSDGIFADIILQLHHMLSIDLVTLAQFIYWKVKVQI